jgi:hypothetical protein
MCNQAHGLKPRDDRESRPQHGQRISDCHGEAAATLDPGALGSGGCRPSGTGTPQGTDSTVLLQFREGGINTAQNPMDTPLNSQAGNPTSSAAPPRAPAATQSCSAPAMSTTPIPRPTVTA